jgi:hypothetical protein
MNTLPILPATRRAEAAAALNPPPAAKCSPAAHTQHPTANEAVPVSTTSTGIGLLAAASRSGFARFRLD